tara:strand:- start:489 stop:653 length:165 start_codon:yes stop_codon:yes gene_type:complete
MTWQNIVKTTLETIVIEEDETIHSFAKKVAEVLERDYGKHNYEAFIKTLKEKLQ